MAKKNEEITEVEAYDPMKNRPNYNDPETARQHKAWKRQVSNIGEDVVPDHQFCPVCDYVMVKTERGLVCGWEPKHGEA
jgi:hypothetical protein